MATTAEPPRATTQDTNPLPATENFVNRRIEYQNDLGTVKYHGPLLHEDKKQDPNQVWLGIQWDNASRGRHNGMVQGVQYFETDDGLDSGSLLKVEKANFGITIYDGILIRYFHNQAVPVIGTENKENGDNKDSKDVKDGTDNKEETEGQVNEKGVQIEYDEEAYFETVRKFKKKVEFLGFDKIWKKINDLKHIKELSLPDCKISDIGPDGSLQQLLPNVSTLSLEANLLFDWNQVFLIGRELKNLEELAISSNRLTLPDEDVRKINKIVINSNDTIINEPPLGVFDNLKTIILISMKLTWKRFNLLAPIFFNVENLVLCYNKMNDFENFEFSGTDFKNLKFLNMEGNELETFEGVMKFSTAPKLEKLTLSLNKMKDLGKVSGFESLLTLIIEENDVSDFYIFSQMNMFPKLENIRITKNPLSTKHNVLHTRQRAIGEISTLKVINGSELKKYERKDCEIYYLRNTFHEYFEKSGQTAYDYDFAQYSAYCASEHPRIPELIKKYGNPYDESMRDQKNAGLEGGAGKVNNAGFIKVKLSAYSGAAMGKPPTVKKLTTNTLVTNLKSILAKQFGIPANKQKIYYKSDSHDPFSALDEDLKDLAYYGVKDDNEIWVGDYEM